MKTARTLYESIVLTVGYALLALICAMLPFVLWSSARVIPVAILGFIGYAYWSKSQSETGEMRWPIRKLWIAFWVVTLFVRVDISFVNLPGPPRITRYAVGLPSPKTAQAARRGEVLMHGCVATGLEPFWLVTW